VPVVQKKGHRNKEAPLPNPKAISPWPEQERLLREDGFVPVCDPDGAWHFLAADLAAARCGRTSASDDFAARLARPAGTA
jgi:hypothetical protein